MIQLLLLLAMSWSLQQPETFIVANVNIVDIANDRIIRNQAIEIRGDTIQRIISADEAPDQDALIDAKGAYAIPGLWDMHVHTGNADVYFPLYIANGIAGVRDMGGGMDRSSGNLSVNFETLSAWREEVRNGSRLGPELLLAGAFVDAAPAFWPGSIEISDKASARTAVQTQIDRGVDFIKVYHNLSSEQLKFVAEEAKRAGIEFAGHIPLSEPPEEMLTLASRLGQASIEHMMQVPAAISSSGVAPSDYRGVVWAYKNALLDIDTDKERALFELFRSNGTWFSTTAVGWWGSGQLNQTPTGEYARQLEFVPQSIRSKDPKSDPQLFDFTSEDYDALRGASLGSAGVAKRMHDAGIGVLAGSDSANPGVVPGFGLHKELEILVEAGFTPAEALQAATLNPAKFLSRSDIGSISPGARADIVLLKGNPLEDIQNTAVIESLILRGEFFPRRTLDDLLHQAKALAGTL